MVAELNNLNALIREYGDVCNLMKCFSIRTEKLIIFYKRHIVISH